MAQPSASTTERYTLPQDAYYRASLQPVCHCLQLLNGGHIGLVPGSNEKAYALSGGVCPERRRDRTTTSVRFKLALQSESRRGSGLIGWRIGDGASDDGFRSGK